MNNSQFLKLNLKDLGHALLAGVLVSIIPAINVLAQMLQNKETIDLGVILSSFITAFGGWLATKFLTNQNGTLGSDK